MGKIIDLSHHNTVDWARAAPELDYVILRASCGMNADTKFAENVRGCEQYGVPYGVYHYVKASDIDFAIAEARFFVDTVRSSHASPTVWFVDIENEAQTAENAEVICDVFAVELRNAGCADIGLYISSRCYPWAKDALTAYDAIWLPRYGKNDGNIPSAEYYPKYPCDLWQYTDKGACAGITGGIDLNILHGDKPLEYFTKTKETECEEMSTIYDPRRVVETALREIGYLEKKSNSQLDDKTANAGDGNYTKYARDLDNLSFYNGKKNGHAWCDVFVDWCLVQLVGKDKALELSYQPTSDNCGAGCKYSRNYYKNNGRLFNTPQAGDQIFFWNGGKSDVSHTGMVVDVDDAYVYTVEGNTSSASGVVANGGGVAQKKYKLSYDRIAGYGRPVWGMSVPKAGVAKLGERVLFQDCGDGGDVTEMQKALMRLGYSLPKYGADGDFGSESKTAVKAFQRDHGLEETGIFGVDTFAALEAALHPEPEPEPEPEPPKPDAEYILILRGDRQRLALVQSAYGGILAAIEKET